MALALTSYVTYDGVRSVLGVGAEEISDTVLALEVYATGLKADLEDISVDVGQSPSTLILDYTTVAGTAEVDRTESAQRLYETARAFATYAVGNQLCGSLPLFSPKSITDGKAQVTRYADSPYKPVIEAMRAGYEKFRGRLESAYSAYKSTAAGALVVMPFLSVVSPSTDQVTGI